MREKEQQYLNIKSSYVRIFFIAALTLVVIAIGLTITFYTLYGQYIEGRISVAKRIVFGINTGVLGSLLVTMSVIGPIVLVASRKMANPFVEMKKVAVAMSEGDFSVRAKDNYSGEMGQLAGTLNQLAAQLAETINALTIEGSLLKQILNSMGDGLLGFDLNQQVNLKNRTFEEMFGIENGLEELQSHISDAINRVSLAVIAHKKIQFETCMFKEKTILITGSPIRSEDNAIVGTVLLFRDTTEAARLEQTRRDYVANVSHELRSPLTAVKGLVIPLKEGMVKDEERRNHFYDVIYDEVERLNRLVNDLFELSRLQSRDKLFDMQVVDLISILYDQQDKFEILAEEKNMKLRVLEHGTPVYAKGNIDRIGQILTILIDNALKFAKENSTITLSAAHEGGKAVVSVHNTGSAILPEDLPLIFDRFYKADKSHTEEGAGLGLSIAKEVISRMNGNIYVKSDGVYDTCFSFELESDIK